MSASPVPDLNSDQTDVHRTYCTLTIRTNGRTTSRLQLQCSSSRGGSWQAGGCLQTIHRRMMVSSHREASWFSFLGPSHLNTWLWPLHVPPRYLWLTSMHRLNPFYPAAPWHHTFFEKVKITQIWRWKHIFCVPATDCVPRNPEIWVPLLVPFGFLDRFLIVAPPPCNPLFFFLYFFVVVVCFFFCGVS